jgi:flagellar hook assembly protein FlgD
MDEAERIESVPKMLTLAANYPNPFNPDTQIRFGLPNSARVNLVIYNLRSQVVRVLVDQEMHAGWHMLRWDGKNEQNQDVASGIYLYILQTDGKRLLRKMMLIR